MAKHSLPPLSLVCLKTANIVSAKDLVKGRNTVIDFWTTACERCPGELDKLDKVAGDPEHHSVNFISICCDKLDGARAMIDQEETPRWANMRHYYIDTKEKERAKEHLGFGVVPFYIALDRDGNICDSGGPGTFDLHLALLLLEHSMFLLPEQSRIQGNMNLGKSMTTPATLDCRGTGVPVERFFAMDDEF